MILFSLAHAVIGPDATTADYPGVVMVTSSGSTTGIQVAPYWVLTTAHSWDSTDFSRTGPDGDAEVRLGRGGSAGFDATLQVEEIRIHPGYVATEPSLNAPYQIGDAGPDGTVLTHAAFDFALVRTSSPGATPMVLAEAPFDDGWLGIPIRTAGFGVTGRGYADAGTLREGSTTLLSYDAAPPLGSGTFVADGVTCLGDGGAPALVRSNGQDLVIGTRNQRAGCEDDDDGFSRVDLALDWIRAQVPEVQTASYTPPQIVCTQQLEDGSGAVVQAPFELRCTAGHPGMDQVETIAWSWGDGTLPEVHAGGQERASHVYDVEGSYRVRACFTVDGLEQCVDGGPALTVCEEPQASFEVERLGSDTVALRNLSPRTLPGCTSDVLWEVYAGDGIEGAPVLTSTSWEPELTLPDGGTYTFVLNVGGIAGTGAAVATLDVSARRGCSVAGGTWLGGFALPLLLVRRRRS